MPFAKDGKWSKEEKMSAPLHDSDEGRSLWLHCAIEAGFLLRQLVTCNQPYEYCCSLVPNALLNFGGQPMNQVGLLWIPHSVEACL